MTLTDPSKTLMYAEAGEAADVVERQFEANEDAVRALVRELRIAPPHHVVTSARGSSDHAATFARYALPTHVGLVSASLPPSLQTLYGAKLSLAGSLFLTLSQSGKSPDLLASALAAKRAGARVVAMVNQTDSPLAEMADVVLPLHAGPERSVAATKTCLASFAAIAHLVARWSEDDILLSTLHGLPEALRRAAKRDWSPLVDGLLDAERLFVLGRGYGLSAASEAALKFMETCGLHAEALSSAEVRHGPMALVNKGFPVLVFGQDDATLPATLAVAREFRQRGARVWCAAPGAPDEIALPIEPAVHPLCAPMLRLQTFYRAANALALRRGYQPDEPPYLNKVTETV